MDNYTVETSWFIPASPNNVITISFDGNKQISLGKEITYIGFENVDDATKAFLDRLIEIYPSWKRELIE